MAPYKEEGVCSHAVVTLYKEEGVCSHAVVPVTNLCEDNNNNNNWFIEVK